MRYLLRYVLFHLSKTNLIVSKSVMTNHACILERDKNNSNFSYSTKKPREYVRYILCGQYAFAPVDLNSLILSRTNDANCLVPANTEDLDTFASNALSI